MPDRTLNWGDSEADARYRTQDSDPTGGDFVVVEDLSGGGQLLVWDYTAGEWAYGGPVNMGGNDITNAGTVSATALEATTTDSKVQNRTVQYPDPKNDFASPQDAIDFAVNNNYADVSVGVGSYATLELTTNIKVRGQGVAASTSGVGNSAIFDGGSSDHGVKIIDGSRATVENIQANTDSGSGFNAINIASTADVRVVVRDCVISNSGSYGVSCQANRAKIVDSHFRSSDIDSDDILLSSSSEDCVVDSNTSDADLTVENNGTGNVIGDNS